jgi:Insertion element 4 transposase N-terminal/Transposase DDE domain
MVDCGLAGGQRLADLVSVGVLASWLPRDAVDEAVEACGKAARRRGGSLPPHVTAYLVIAMALFPDGDYEDVAARLAAGLDGLGCWDQGWEPTSGGITRARQRLGAGPLEELFGQVAVPVAELDTAGAFLGPWRLMSVDGMEWDVPDTAANREAFGRRAGKDVVAAFPKARVVTVAECGSHAPVLAAIGPSAAGKGSGEQVLARRLYPRLEEGWLLLADRNFYCFADWCAAQDTGADLLWRVKENTRLPPLEALPDGSYRSVLIDPRVPEGPRREAVIEAARRGEDLDADIARPVRVVEYDVPDRGGNGEHERIVLAATITSWQAAPAPLLAAAYHQRWEHEGANGQVKTFLRGPGRVLRSRSPAMAEQEIWGYLLAHYALCALICAAATAAGIDPDRVKFKRTLRIVRRAVGPAFPP